MATVTVKNIDKLTSKLNKMIDMDLKDAMNKATTLIHGQAKALAPVDTGQLAGSIHMEVKEKKDGLEGRVYTNTEYAPYVEFGTGEKGNGTYPYDVEGLNLSYADKPWTYTPDGGETFYRSHGQVAQPFMYPALKQNEKYIKNLFKETVKEDIETIVKGE